LVTASASGRVMSVEEMDLPTLDVLGPTYAADPNGVLRTLRASGNEMARSHRGIELLTYGWAAALLNDERFHTVDSRHFSDKGAPDSLLRFVEDGLLLSMEPARHDRIRKVLARAFTLRGVDQQRRLMRDIGARLVSSFEDRGTVDLVEEFTQHYPIEALCRLIGVPAEEISRFLAAAHDLHLMAAVPMAPGFARIDEALATLEAYVVDILDRRRREPRDDFISGLIEAQDAEGALSRSELVGNVINLLFAGAGTTRYQLASTVRAVVEHGLWDELAATPELVPAAVEEGLRYYPVTQFVVRIPDDDVVIDDLMFPARRRVILNLRAASRDPEAFVDPDRFDVNRDNAGRSRLPFGWGTHHCLGHALARAVMAEGLVLLTERLAGVEIAAEIEVAHPGAMLVGPQHLHLTFIRRQAA
jgi:cytochrome P450